MFWKFKKILSLVIPLVPFAFWGGKLFIAVSTSSVIGSLFCGNSVYYFILQQLSVEHDNDTY